LIIASLYFPFDNLSIHIAIQENEGHYVYGKYYKEINSMAFLKLFRTEKRVKKRRTMGESIIKKSINFTENLAYFRTSWPLKPHPVSNSKPGRQKKQNS
jgi:hypothetical protein